MSGSRWQPWVDRTEVRVDRVAQTPARALAATLDRTDLIDIAEGEPLPPLWIWLSFLPLAPSAQIGPDGHPRRGGFLPPVELERRMWAGSRCTFHAPIRVGDAVERTSTIAKVAEKDGKAGPMVFVTVRHAIAAEGRLAMEEEQDIVFLDIPDRFAPPPPTPLPPCDWSERTAVDPVTLFRFSALTFNGHRIHYDRSYATEVERYPGLVVHGPLQAVLLFDAATRHAPERAAAAFAFRGLRPLFDFDAVSVNGRSRGDGLELFTANAEGAVGMQATLDWGRRVIPARLERSTLVVPASNPAMIAKAAAARADAVCLDCEDAVAPDAKAQARGHAVHALNTLDFGGKLRLVRINGLDTPYAYRDLVEIVEGAGANLDLVVTPKVGGRDEVRFVATLLEQIEAACGLHRPIGIEALIETASGVLNVREIVEAHPRLEALIYGSGDYAASLGMPMATIGGFDAHDALYPGHRWHHVMHAIVVAARARGLRAIDGPFADFRDAAELERTARIGRAMGFDGKWCIHPSQPGVVDGVYAPAPEEVAWAGEVMAAYEAATAQGRGAISVRGRMVDAANLRMCRDLLARHRLAERAPT